jgi:hypothetical protein
VVAAVDEPVVVAGEPTGQEESIDLERVVEWLPA